MTLSSITIRPYQQADRDALKALVLRLHETIRPLDEDLEPGDVIIDKYFNGLLSKVEQSQGALFFAEQEGKTLGYVCLYGQVEPEALDVRLDRYSFIAELFIAPECRGQGVGKALMAAAERHAAECGSYKLELEVLADNQSAIEVYKALGYSPKMLVMRKYLPTT